ncbi:MAG TPA: hypothetical protein ENK49_13545 [Gammaproteobacteria bacterium]|nr:hypothetical protein [Gammaproteobacteria bacterium]
MPEHKLLIMCTALATLMLAACDDRKPGAQTPASAKKATFSASITGAVDEALKGRGWLLCEKTNGASPEQENTFSFRIPGTGTRQEFELEFPQALGTGTHPVYGFNTLKGLQADTARVLYVTSDGSKFSQDGTSGELTITALPQKAGDVLSGMVKATITAKDYSGEKIHIDAKFDMPATAEGIEACL